MAKSIKQTNLHASDLSVDQYVKVLNADNIIKERSKELLSLLYHSASIKPTSEHLASVLGYDDGAPVNALIGKLAKRIGKYYGFEKEDIKGEYSGWWQFLATGNHEEYGFVWTIKDNLKTALENLGFIKPKDEELLNKLEEHILSDNKKYMLPEESDISHHEGATRKIIVNRYERNIKARKECIRKYGAICNVCEMDFEDKYGELGKDFIHVHHIVPLSKIKKEYEVDPVKDLRPVCPNCHAMLHLGKTTLTIEQLKELINQIKLK